MKSTDASVVLVPSWLLRSIMLADCPGTGATLLILRGRSYGISRERLIQIIEQKELLLSLGPPTPTITLLVEPQEEWLRSTADPLVLREYWRLLFQARVHVAVKDNIGAAGESHSDGPSRTVLHDRIERIGWSVFNDARFVLLRERLVPPAADDAEVYARFAATFLDLNFFAPSLLPGYFALVDDPQRVLDALRMDVDAETLLQQTRPAGSADPPGDEASPLMPEPDLAPQAESESPAEGQRTLIERRAARAASVGNNVHAAILHQRASRRSLGRSLVSEALANPYFARFVQRLTTAAVGGEQRAASDAGSQSSIHAPATAQDHGARPTPADARSFNNHVFAAEWADALAPVLARSADSWRNAESRLLYDLQKVCADSERGIYALDALGWLFTLGWRPLRRPVPAQGLVLTCKHLRSAIGRLSKCQLTPAQRAQLEGLLRAALRQAEGRMRESLRPAVSEALDRSGLRPQHRVEEVAREKLVEEFLDGLVRRGFARMGDLRDTISRNQLKLHDLTGVSAFLRGDQLLQIDRRLSKPLDGVYHAGEAYLRLFQRLSSLLFATPAGRLFTYYGLVPFGGAFLILEVLGHTVGNLYTRLAGGHIPFDHPAFLLLLGLFLMALVNVEPFRRGVTRSLKMIGNLARWVVNWRGWRLCRQLVDLVMASPTWRVVVRYGLKPAVVTYVAWRLMPPGVSWTAGVPTLLVIYAAAAVTLNSRTFRMSTYVLAHFAVVLWMRLVSDLFVGLYRAVVRIFRLLLERLERTLYSVDEWFRFRGGQGNGLLVIKAGLGAVWAIVAYWVRFGVTLLLEPQINPIKHFPVVTVSHKLILPTVPHLATVLRSLGVDKVEALTYATSIAFVTPGVFGFLAWELKENWRLYAANRSKTLRAVRMGSHGETLAQMLRPGVHSGTVPRIFARLRRAGSQDAGRPLRRQEESLERAGRSIGRFLGREFAGLLNRHPAWNTTPVSIGAVDLAATRVRVALECPSLGLPARLSFEQHDGWIVAGIDGPGWILAISPPQAAVLGLALLGLYQLAGADLVREQIEALFAPQPVRWTIRGDTLIAWTGPKFGAESRYRLKEDPAAVSEGSPRRQPGSVPGGVCLPSPMATESSHSSESCSQDLASVPLSSLLLHRQLVNWQSWTRLWDLPVRDWDDALASIARAGMSVLPTGCPARDMSFTPAPAGFR